MLYIYIYIIISYHKHSWCAPTPLRRVPTGLQGPPNRVPSIRKLCISLYIMYESCINPAPVFSNVIVGLADSSKTWQQFQEARHAFRKSGSGVSFCCFYLLFCSWSFFCFVFCLSFYRSFYTTIHIYMSLFFFEHKPTYTTQTTKVRLRSLLRRRLPKQAVHIIGTSSIWSIY